MLSAAPTPLARAVEETRSTLLRLLPAEDLTTEARLKYVDECNAPDWLSKQDRAIAVACETMAKAARQLVSNTARDRVFLPLDKLHCTQISEMPEEERISGPAREAVNKQNAYVFATAKKLRHWATGSTKRPAAEPLADAPKAKAPRLDTDLERAVANSLKGKQPQPRDAATEARREAELKALLAKLNVVVVPVRGDGSCLFHCFRAYRPEVLFTGSDGMRLHTVDALRLHVARWLKDNKDMVVREHLGVAATEDCSAWVGDNGEPFDQLMDQLASSSEYVLRWGPSKDSGKRSRDTTFWITEALPHLVGLALQVRVVVVLPGSTPLVCGDRSVDPNTREIVLLKDTTPGVDHYNTVKPKNDKRPRVASAVLELDDSVTSVTTPDPVLTPKQPKNRPSRSPGAPRVTPAAAARALVPVREKCTVEEIVAMDRAQLEQFQVEKQYLDVLFSWDSKVELTPVVDTLDLLNRKYMKNPAKTHTACFAQLLETTLQLSMKNAQALLDLLSSKPVVIASFLTLLDEPIARPQPKKLAPATQFLSTLKHSSDRYHLAVFLLFHLGNSLLNTVGHVCDSACAESGGCLWPKCVDSCAASATPTVDQQNSSCPRVCRTLSRLDGFYMEHLQGARLRQSNLVHANVAFFHATDSTDAELRAERFKCIKELHATDAAAPPASLYRQAQRVVQELPPALRSNRIVRWYDFKYAIGGGFFDAKLGGRDAMVLEYAALGIEYLHLPGSQERMAELVKRVMAAGVEVDPLDELLDPTGSSALDQCM